MMSKSTFHYGVFLTLLILMVSCQSSEKKPLTLNPLFTDHMVLQQQTDASIWGTCSPFENITISGSWGSETTVHSDESGKWLAKLSTPAAGGPYQVKISTQETKLTIDDVLIGEVWIGSGQSNMEMPLTGFLPKEPVMNYQQEIENAQYPLIRMFTVERNYSLNVVESVGGDWQVCSPETADKFSATAYFFARKLQTELNIPVGIIHTSWGGTVAEAWTSREGLTKFPEFIETIDGYSEATVKEWCNQFVKLPMPSTLEEFEDIDMNQGVISAILYDDAKWSDIQMPLAKCYTNLFISDNAVTQDLHGIFWYRKQIKIDNIEQDYTLNIGAIDDGDITYVNGQKIGSTLSYNKERSYTIPKSLLKKGENTIAIMHYDSGGGSSISGPMSLTGSNGVSISIEGDWKGLFFADLDGRELVIYGLDHQEKLQSRPKLTSGGPNELPSSLYNAMIQPLIPFTIKGAIWYQGESNVGRAQQYEELFPIMIEDWRSHWSSDFPFYFVQIAPFDYGSNMSPFLRDAQRHSLSTAHTGMAITLDIGEEKSIHPANKQDVGLRLALLALANDYGQNIVSSGPIYKNHIVDDKNIEVSFDYVGSGLVSKGSGLSDFEVAGEDRQFVQAKASIIGDRVVVHSPKVSKPVYVRYGWNDFVMGSLFNQEGLPASSFSTED